MSERLVGLVASCRPSYARATLAATQQEVAAIACSVSILWEAAREHDMWAACGHLHLGLLHGKSKRCRRIPGSFKKAVTTEWREARGRGVRKITQLLPGMRAALKRDGRRKTTTVPGASASSQPAGAGKLDFGPSTARSFEDFDMYNYFLCSRTAPSE
ncbi:MAG: hypothetical protein GY772_09015 [bacterium]|nr:hypothetical protein [bacterium]